MKTQAKSLPVRRPVSAGHVITVQTVAAPEENGGHPSDTLPAAEHGWHMHEGLLDYVGAARYLGTTPRHVRELWAKRYLAAIKVGRHVRFSRRDLDAFIAANRVEAKHLRLR